MVSLSLRPSSRLRLATVVSAFLATVATPAHAELVEHTFTGTVDQVSDGTGGTLDLRGTFSVGQTFTLVAVVDLSTPGEVVQSVHTAYINVVPTWSLAIGGYVRSAGPPINPVPIFMVNNLSRQDRFYMPISSPGSPAIGSSVADFVVIDLADHDAVVFPDDSLPRTIQDLSEFDFAGFQMIFVSPTASGSVVGTIGDVTTPARTTTWGRLKSGYRD